MVMQAICLLSVSSLGHVKSLKSIPVEDKMLPFQAKCILADAYDDRKVMKF
jgi:hypothetical protein